MTCLCAHQTRPAAVQRRLRRHRQALAGQQFPPANSTIATASRSRPMRGLAPYDRRGQLVSLLIEFDKASVFTMGAGA